MRRLVVAAVILMAVPGVAWAGGGGVDTSGCAGYSEGVTVAMEDSCFSGTAHFAPSGTAITVDNDGQLPHTLTAVDGSFDTELVSSGSSAQLTIDEPGVYRVFCSLHGTAQGAGMAGVLVVGHATPTAGALPAETTAATDARLLEVLDGLEAADAVAAPQVLTLDGDVAPVQLVILLMVGLGVGLALSALLTVLRLRIADSPPAGPSQSSVE